MKSFTDRYLRMQGILYKIEQLGATLLMLAISGIVLAGVFSRYLLAEPFYGTDRLATYVFVILSFWGIQMASGYYEHITVGAVRQWMGTKVGAYLSALASLLTALFLGYLAWMGYGFVRFLYDSQEKDIVLGIPMWGVYVFFIAAAILSAFRYMVGVYLWIEVARGRLDPAVFQRKTLT